MNFIQINFSQLKKDTKSLCKLCNCLYLALVNTSLLPIYEQYNFLLPSKKEGLVVFGIHQKIKSKEIDSNFTYQDIELVIKEVVQLEPGGIPQTENLLKTLLHHFIERPAEKKTRYKLTNYALDFIALVNHKLNNPFRKFPLRDSFQQYASFKAQDMVHIHQFESWYEQGFNATTRKNIVNHLEALKDDTNASILELKSILLLDDASVTELVNKFSDIFEDLGRKAEEIKDTLLLGNNLNQEIQKVVDSFYKKTEALYPKTEDELTVFGAITADYKRTETISLEVREFFGVINEKLAELNDRILFASGKLTELQDNFRYQSRFKLNIRRLLELILTESQQTGKELTLPESFPRYQVPYHPLKLIEVPYIESFLPSVTMVKPRAINIAYEQQERTRIIKELDHQATTARLVKKYKELLATGHEIDFTKHFYEIMDTEQEIEVPLQVGFELIQFANQSIDYGIRVQRVLPQEALQKTIAIWNMKIYHKEKATSHS